MSDDFIPFWGLLASAEDQLRAGTEPETMEDLARTLASRHPGNMLAERLAAQAAHVRSLGAGDPTSASASSMPHLL